ncbi:GNAT family N-acetyltransferase [Stackebrandtia nassauensis]|uniref:GCN5-related N-acetyltransferase n=1 Tax=Stackebrandtia nassauensis (strain DSM 44728 / CIP 108903 / NRRL B-16338 / NBRC 102104 / LLR-40K-21) TaxID=446470 RepID=D3Q9I5_STANL|nr:GNAT family protein [Stackebrandtia nassauensis]ADD42667.1 GCN5-related N-acetyltransferase [Stackebrandtia nassauensis DSM 44728]
MCANPPVTLTADAVATTPALLLRPWHPADAAALATAHDDPDMRRTLMFPLDGIAEARDWIGRQVESWNAGTRHSFAVLGADDERILGHVVVKMVSDFDPAAVEVGYWTVTAARGLGVAPRAVATVTPWIFAEWDRVKRVDLLHAVDNPASCRVADKSGFRLEAELPPRPPEYPGPGHRHVRDRD